MRVVHYDGQWNPMRKNTFFLFLICLGAIISCQREPAFLLPSKTPLPADVLDYSGTPDSAQDRRFLAFSDQGAWFGYGFPTDTADFGGFSGPFLMTQENGKWCGPALSRLQLIKAGSRQVIDWRSFRVSHNSYISHLEQTYTGPDLSIGQWLFFTSPHTALIITRITNLSDQKLELIPGWNGSIFAEGLRLRADGNVLTVKSDRSPATGYIRIPGNEKAMLQVSDKAYSLQVDALTIRPQGTATLLLAQSFLFPEYDDEREQEEINRLAGNYAEALSMRIHEKEEQFKRLTDRLGGAWSQDRQYRILLAKTLLTLQNNWRIPAGELRHAGLFPSYHMIWFHGFWAWDSWKHAAALAQYDPTLAKEQVRAMYDFQNEQGFLPDCVFRDTTIERHNYRNTKPPLSAWAVWSIYQRDPDQAFLKELYPRIKLQHAWWYQNRDHDRDSLCEYGSTDGALIAAKWESGMDNAVRFDNSRILKNREGAYSLDQESVDLNAYLYAEKGYLKNMARALKIEADARDWDAQAEALKKAIQTQFYDPKTGWFYDTSLDGAAFIPVMGCEGWIPLWAGAASTGQAEAVKAKMMDPAHFNTRVPLQTLDVSHPEFRPERGYWRGPNWLDQAWFGIKGLQRYGFEREAAELSRKLVHNSEGVLQAGPTIRENYNPLTGAGMEAENFSWSAAHFLMLLLNE